MNKAKINETKNYFYTRGQSRSLFNPGTLSKIHSSALQVEPIWLDGVNLRCKNTLNLNQSFVMQTLLSQLSPSGCRIGCSWQRQDSANEFILLSPSIFIDTNPMSLCTNIKLSMHPIPSLQLRFNGQIKQSENNDTNFIKFEMPKRYFSCKWFGKSNTLSLDVVEMTSNSAKSTISFLQKVLPFLDVGTEMLLCWSPEKNIEISNSLAAKYSTKHTTIAGTFSLSTLNFDMSVFKQLNSHFQIGTTVAYNTALQNAVGAIYYKYDTGNASVRAKLDTNKSIGFTYDRSFARITAGFSLLLNQNLNKFLYGFKFEIN